MTIDSHHHFWNYSVEEYGWIGDGMDVLKRSFGPDDLKPLLDKAGVDGVVSVQARTKLEENAFLLDYADKHDWIKGVVGWVDLTKGDVGDTLAKYGGRDKLVGVREVLQGMDDDAYCLREDFNQGVARLHDFGLVYDILIFHRHLPNAAKFVDKHENQTFVLDHVAKPAIESPVPDAAWVKNMKALGERESVYCKISGMVTEIRTEEEWTPDLLRRYFDATIEAFGADRIMYGSDWPVCLLRSDYVRWSETVKGFINELSSDEQAAIRGGNAVNAYRLNV